MTPRSDLCALCEDPERPLPDKRWTAHKECRSNPAFASRRCKRCKKVKAVQNFSRDSSRPDGRFPWCKFCQSESTRTEYAFQDPDAPLNGKTCPVDDVPLRGRSSRNFCSQTCAHRVKALKDRYGLSIQDYRKMVDATGGLCPICLQKTANWQVDHNHKTREVTGVVCVNCNTGLLANSMHDAQLVAMLFRYLRNTPARELGIVALAPNTPAGNRKSNLNSVWKYGRMSRK